MDDKRCIWNSEIKFVFFEEEDDDDNKDDCVNTSKSDVTSDRGVEQPTQTCIDCIVVTSTLNSQMETTLSLQCTQFGDATVCDYAIPRAVRGRISARVHESSVAAIKSVTDSTSKWTELFSHSQTGPQHFKISTQLEDREQHEIFGTRPNTAKVPAPMRPLLYEDTTTKSITMQNLCKLTELCHGMSGLNSDRARTHEITSQRHGLSSSFPLMHYHKELPVKGTASSQPHSTPITSELCLISSQPRYLMMAAQPDVNELQRLQYEALGARPRSAVISTPRRPLSFGESGTSCNFCKRNGELPEYYCTHNLDEGGRITCPVLRRYVCPLCGATGENAHTISYCPFSRGASSASVIRTRRQSCGCKKGHCKHAEGNR